MKKILSAFKKLYLMIMLYANTVFPDLLAPAKIARIGAYGGT